MVAGLVLALDGKAQEGVDITKFGGTAMSDKRQAT
jgi:transcription-repair coupling factor (superfamily II helicase)